VMTNSTFTKGAIELAKATGVLLWDGNTIEKMFSNVNIYK
ncbi:MAG: restriction endonuclease, partial [Oscillospiraceae bacterium]|nr:restriction endonuclease [Oscillospiraceae bacterium]